MQSFISVYIPKKPDQNYLIPFNNEENQVWEILYKRQLKIAADKTCAIHQKGLEMLHFPKTKIPQVPDVNPIVENATGWKFEPVPQLIDTDDFFNMLAKKHFPVISFIRPIHDLDTVPEPDCFHEFFGHGPFLTDPNYCEFMYQFAKIYLSSPKEVRPLLQRFYWLTVEFGLIQDEGNLRVYGAGILASHNEIDYALNSNIPLRIPYDPVAIFRTPYRMDLPQPIYYVLPSFSKLYDLLENDVFDYIAQAKELGELEPLFNTNNAKAMNLHIGKI